MTDVRLSSGPPALPALNPEQQLAVAAITNWLAAPPSSPFVLSGSAGTGKTFCLRQLIPRISGPIAFTAPTNKAVKVIRDSLTSNLPPGSNYNPDCRTVYSLLGLRLEPTGEVRQLSTPGEAIDLSSYELVVVDEASMVNSELFRHITAAAHAHGFHLLFLGDAAQLPPVGETKSEVWSIPHGAALTQVMRFDNRILGLATWLRGLVNHPAPAFDPPIKYLGNGEVYKLRNHDFRAMIRLAAESGEFLLPTGAKILAWRNATVEAHNAFVRQVIFDTPKVPWLPTDRVIFTAPAKSSDGEPLTTTDDEGTIERVSVGPHPVHLQFQCQFLRIRLDTNRTVQAQVLDPAPANITAHAAHVSRLAEEARANPRKWPAFWAFKDSFHSLRHGYALTAHRSQGSSYDSVFVDSRDILANRDRGEAFRCLYVACTRPRGKLVIL